MNLTYERSIFSIYLPNYLRMGFSAWTLLMFGAGSFFVVRPVLCTVGCLAASLASTEEMPVTPSTHALVTTTNVSGLCQCPLGGKIVQLTTIAQKYSFPTKTTMKATSLFSHPVVSDSLRAHVLQHARPPCSSPCSRVCPSSCPLHW